MQAATEESQQATETEPLTLTYYNRKKGQTVPRTAVVSYHARVRFRRRWLRLFRILGPKPGSIFDPKYMPDMLSGDVGQCLRDLFGRARKICVNQYDRKLKKRNRKHGNGIRFRACPFEFVFQDLVLVTVEICKQELREHN
jgi:hypothetical protein